MSLTLVLLLNDNEIDRDLICMSFNLLHSYESRLIGFYKYLWQFRMDYHEMNGDKQLQCLFFQTNASYVSVQLWETFLDLFSWGKVSKKSAEFSTLFKTHPPHSQIVEKK